MKYTSIACRVILSVMDGEENIVVCCNSRKLLQLWQIRLCGQVEFHTGRELDESPSNIQFTSCGTMLSICEGKSSVVLRSVRTLNSISVIKTAGETVVDSSFVSNADISTNSKSRSLTPGEDNCIAICYDSGSIKVPTTDFFVCYSFKYSCCGF